MRKLRTRATWVVSVTAGLAIALFGLIAPAASAATSGGSGHTVTITQHFHGTQPLAVTNPCTGDPLAGSESTNAVSHETYFPASDEAWGTFTEEDSGVLTDQLSGETYSFHDTNWGGFSLNRQNSTQGFTSTLHASGSLGDSVYMHEVARMTLLPDGTLAVSFDNLTFSCSP